MAILPVPPAFPVPVLPQVFDTSLSYYELLAKLTQQINVLTVQVNQNTTDIAAISGTISGIAETTAQLSATVAELEQQIGGIPGQIQGLIDGLAAEAAAREDADDSLARQFAELHNLVMLFYVRRDELKANFLVGDITFQMLTQAEYDALTEYVDRRIYFVLDENGRIKQYYNGSAMLSGSTLGSMTRLATGQNTAIYANWEV